MAHPERWHLLRSPSRGMRAPVRKRLGAALAVAAVALALTSCTSSPPTPSSAAAAADPAVSATSQTLKQRAEKAAAAILGVGPAAAGRVSAWLRRLVCREEAPTSPSRYRRWPTWEVHLTTHWEAPGGPLARCSPGSWRTCHARSTPGDAAAPARPRGVLRVQEIPSPGVPLASPARAS